jgi:hypothetical protein
MLRECSWLALRVLRGTSQLLLWVFGLAEDADYCDCGAESTANEEHCQYEFVVCVFPGDVCDAGHGFLISFGSAFLVLLSLQEAAWMCKYLGSQGFGFFAGEHGVVRVGSRVREYVFCGIPV